MRALKDPIGAALERSRVTGTSLLAVAAMLIQWGIVFLLHGVERSLRERAELGTEAEDAIAMVGQLRMQLDGSLEALHDSNQEVGRLKLLAGEESQGLPGIEPEMLEVLDPGDELEQTMDPDAA